MTRNECNVFLAAILETVAASPTGAPAGVMYAALCGRMDLLDFEGLLTIAKEVGLVTRDASHVIKITAKGRATVAKIEASRVNVTA